MSALLPWSGTAVVAAAFIAVSANATSTLFSTNRTGIS